jgi:hypothetical protein
LIRALHALVTSWTKRATGGSVPELALKDDEVLAVLSPGGVYCHACDCWHPTATPG